MLKRTFIPPDHRPYVKGAQLDDANCYYLNLFKNNRLRRQFIVNILEGSQSFPDLDARWTQSILGDLFPNLRLKLSEDA